jgi:HEAT repeat protein
MGIERSKLYNEPLEVAWRDVAPAAARIRPERLGAAVQARMDLESGLRVCGVEPQARLGTLQFTSVHRRVLVRMLSETDSPLSASLRAAAAAAAGPLKLTEAAPVLRKMAVDEKEDRRTRLHAIESYISLGGASAARDLAAILRSRDPLARSSALVAALRTDAPPLVKIARAHLQREKDAGIRALVSRRVSGLNMETATVRSSVAPAIPAEGRLPKETRK